MNHNVNATKLNNYYESLRSNVMSILGHVRMPNDPVSATSAGLAVAASGSHTSGLTHGPPHMASSASSSMPDNISQENFDSYLSKLQTICTENMADEGVNSVGMASHNSSSVGVPPSTKQPVMYDSVKSALQNFNALSTRI